MVKIKTTASGLKQIEAILLTTAILFIGLGATTTEQAIEDKGNTTLYMMGIGLILVGVLLVVIYIYVEKNDDAPDNGDIDAAIKDTEPKPPTETKPPTG